MPFPEAVRSLLAIRAASDPDAAKLLEMLKRADATFERVPERATQAPIYAQQRLLWLLPWETHPHSRMSRWDDAAASRAERR